MAGNNLQPLGATWPRNCSISGEMPNRIRTARSPWRWAALLVCAVTPHLSSCKRSASQQEATAPVEAPPPNVPGTEVETWKSSALKVEEDRGEPMGLPAKAEVPTELRHYADRHRFLAIQVAESREQDLPIPYDYAELVQLIHEGGLVEMKPLGEDYVLYGVGATVSDGPFTHYDARRDIDVPLFSGYDEFEDEYNRLAASIEPITAPVELWKGERLRVPASQKRRRATLLSRIRAGERQIGAVRAKQEVLAFYYQDWDRRRLLVGKYRALADLATNLDGNHYDLDDAGDRRRFKARLLSFIRPEARDVILQIARDYKQKFGRPLPVTSLVRTEEYQARLGRSGVRNATKISTPPHTTGLAFDVLYKFMSKAEQEWLMGHVAELEAEGRVEALRELTNHYHIFAFPDGQRPNETLIQASLRQVDAELPTAKPAPRKAKASSKAKARAKTPAKAKAAPRASRAARATPVALKTSRARKALR